MKYLIAVLVILPFILSFPGCGDSNPVAPDDGTGPDTTAADTTAADTSASRTPFLVPLAMGASWQYSIFYEWRVYDPYSDFRDSTLHYASLGVEVVASDPEKRSFSLSCRFVVDSSFSSPHLEPSSPDTTFLWELITVNDTVFYISGDSLLYCMPWDSPGRAPVDLRYLDYPWKDRFSFWIRIWRWSYETDHWIYEFNQSISRGAKYGYFIPSRGGLIEYDVFYAPSSIAWQEEARLEYRLLEYVPGNPDG